MDGYLKLEISIKLPGALSEDPTTEDEEESGVISSSSEDASDAETEEEDENASTEDVENTYNGPPLVYYYGLPWYQKMWGRCCAPPNELWM